MELQFIGAAHEVTGSCHFLQVGNKKILVDCGMRQGALKFENVSLPVDASKILAYYAYVSTTKEKLLSMKEYMEQKNK